MRSFLAALSFALILPCAVHAQTTYEMEGRSFLLPGITCNGTAQGQKIAYPPDLQAAFPNGIPITQAILVNQAPAPPPGQSAIWTVSFDRQGRYVANSGWPLTQNGSFYPLFGFVALGPGAGQPVFSPTATLSPPLMWRPGDLLLVDFSCVGGGSADPALALSFQVPFGQTVLGPFNTQWNGQPNPVTTIGKSQSVSGAQISLVTTAAAPAGSTIIVAAVSNANYSAPTASDGVNTYSLMHNFNSAMVFLESAPLTTALPAGSVITINSGGAVIQSGWIAGAAVTGITSSTVDGVNTSATASVSPGTLPSAPQVVFGLAVAYNGGNSAGSITQTTGYTSIANDGPFGTQNFSVDFDYYLATTTTPPAYSWSASVTSPNSMVMALPGQ